MKKDNAKHLHSEQWMGLKVINLFIIISSAFSCYSQALTFNESMMFDIGVPAASCVYSIPDNKPLSIPRTIIADNSAPNGTVLYSWNYNDFLPNYSLQCTGSGNKIPGLDSRLDVRLIVGFPLLGDVAPTNNPGIGVRFYYMFGQDSMPCDFCAADSPGGPYYFMNFRNYPGGSEKMVTSGQDMYIGAIFSLLKFSSDNQYGYYSDNVVAGRFSIRAELVKIGNITYDSSSTPLKVDETGIQQMFISSYTGPVSIYGAENILGSNGVNIARPTCWLKTKDYIITMPGWVTLGPDSKIPGTSLPASGNEVPVNLSLECSGEVPNIRFKFEDTGSTLLSDKNISLYDSSGGDKIDGLEIEMLYNNAHIDVDNSTMTNVGTHGQTKLTYESTDSTSAVRFEARFLQRAPITKNGNTYTGPVTGRVNMWMTYD